MNDHPTNSPTTAPAVAGEMPPEVLRQIGRGILISLQAHSPAVAESPPEATLAGLLGFVLHAVDGIEVLRREHVVLPSNPAMEVELDLLIRQPATGAAAVISVEGHRWHRRSQEEHDQEIRRDRLIRRSYGHVERYAAREVMADPWGVVLDLIQMLEGTWTDFAEVAVPTGMRALVAACAGEAVGADTAREAEPQPDRGPLSTLDRVRQVAANLPAPHPTSDPALLALREVTPRLYAPWDPAEVEVLRDAYHAWIDVDDIARAMGRTPGAVWMQLRRMGLVTG